MKKKKMVLEGKDLIKEAVFIADGYFKDDAKT